VIGAVLVGLLLLAGCSSDDDGAKAAETTTTVAPEPIRVLVTNDDGVQADGIDALVQGLRGVEGVEVVVVAPATNQSGVGGQSTEGALTVTDATTRSGVAAKAVAGFPADTVTWAIDDHGIDGRPDLVISGINAGQNMGPVVDLSGTVGAARAAVARGIPALAASAGLGDPIDYASAVAQVLDWFTANRDAIADGTLTTDTVANLNVPTCTAGTVRGQVTVPAATSSEGYTDPPNCQSTATSPTDDIQAFLDGFAPLSAISPTPAAAS
jgi:5'-nucleotidase